MSFQFNPSDVLIRVQRQFGDESGVQVTDKDVLRWITDSLREATTQNPKLLQTTIFVNVVAGSNSFTLAPASPYGVLRINSVYFNQSGQYYKLDYMTLQEIDTYINGWSGTQSSDQPLVYSYEISPNNNNVQVIVYPTPNATVDLGFKVNYDSTPLELTSVSDVVAIPAAYFNYVVEYCLMKAYELDEDWEVADRKAQYIQSTLNLLSAQDYLGNDFYPSIMVLPEDAA